jgi:membrane-associated phospholipid phosphatase
MSRQLIRRFGKTPIIREGAPLLGLYWLYSSIRWLLARDSPYEAFNNAFKIIDLERQLGIFFELKIQALFIENALRLVKVANSFYTWGYFPVLILCGVLLYRSDPWRFHIFRLSFLLGLGLALICFSVFPLAPPRMLPEAGFIDTQAVFGSGLYKRKLVLSFYNPYAAMPSLHFGCALLVGLMAYSFKSRVLKVIGIAYPVFMAWVVVTTGHHYLLDIVGGGLVVALAYSLVANLSPVSNALSTAQNPPERGVAVGSEGVLLFSTENENVMEGWRHDRHQPTLHARNPWSDFEGLLINRLPPR